MPGIAAAREGRCTCRLVAHSDEYAAEQLQIVLQLRPGGHGPSHQPANSVERDPASELAPQRDRLRPKGITGRTRPPLFQLRLDDCLQLAIQFRLVFTRR